MIIFDGCFALLEELKGLGIRSSVFSCMPDTQHIDLGFPDFVAHLVIVHQDVANLTRFELFQFFSDAWILLETGRGGCQ